MAAERSLFSRLLLIAMVAPLFPALAGAQEIVKEALSSFPADTQQITYANLGDIRSLANYAQLRQTFFTPELRGFEESLRSTGIDPEKDVDEVVFGWRGQGGANGGAGFFGLAAGQFQPDQAQKYYARQKLPITDYADQHLYAVGSGGDSPHEFFTFLSGSLAAFGRLSDLKTLLDVRGGTRAALDSNTSFSSWEAELENTGQEWGLATGSAAAQAGQWLTAGVKLPMDLSTLMGPVRAVLYRFDLSNQVAAHVSVVCQSPETAAALAKIISIWRDSPSATAKTAPEVSTVLQGLDVSSNGTRVELTGSAPLSLVGSLNH